MASILVPNATMAGRTLISTTTLTGASVTLDSIPNAYKDLYLIIRNFIPATDGTEFGLRFNADSNANRHRDVGFGTTQVNTVLGFNATYTNFNCGHDNGVGTGLIVARIPDYTNTVTWKKVTYETLAVDPTTTTSFRQSLGMGMYNQTSAITSLQLLPATGNFTSGTVLLYGVN